MNVFYNTIVFVRDIKISKHFYENVIGIKVVQDHGTIVFFEDHFTIHTGNDLLNTIYKKKPFLNKKKGKKNIEIYFETDDINESYENIKRNNVPLIHGKEKQAWGQSVFRFYDPDNHIIEIGEAMHINFLLDKNPV